MADMHAPNEEEDFISTTEFGWMDSSSSKLSLEDIDGELNQDIFEDPETPITRHGPIIHADPLELEHQRQFWYQCALGFFLDYRRFIVHHLQQTLNIAWRLRDRVIVVGREAYFYVLHFDSQEDLLHVREEGPWSVKGALLIVEKWRPNMVLDSLGLYKITIWEQLYGLPWIMNTLILTCN